MHWFFLFSLMSMLEKYNNFIFSHALQNGNIKKSQCVDPTQFFFFCLFDCKHCTRVRRITFQWCWLFRWHIKKTPSGYIEYTEKMSQEIKTPSIVNFHNELSARFPFSIFFLFGVLSLVKTNI